MDPKRYTAEGGKAVIEIVVQDIHSLFDERDPAPFREKDLDDDAVEYIVESAREISVKHLGKIKVLIHEGLDEKIGVHISSAIHSFFRYETEMMAKKIKETLRTGVKSLVIGLLFLTFAVLVSSSVKADADDFWKLFFKEGMFLIGWVSMWKPINVFLYDWWPLVDTLNIYKCLSLIKIEALPLKK